MIEKLGRPEKGFHTVAEQKNPETRGAKLAYTEEFKELIAENPGAIRTFLKLAKQLAGRMPDETAEEKGIKVTLISIPSFYSEDGVESYKVELGEKKFFVKKEKEFSFADHSGFDEVKSSAKAKELLKNVPGVEVEDFQLGYTDKRHNNYFVAKWMGLGRISDYLNGNQISKKKKDELWWRVSEIEDLLPTYSDIMPYNMFYDPKTEKIVLFDLYEWPPDRGVKPF